MERENRDQFGKFWAICKRIRSNRYMLLGAKIDFKSYLSENLSDPIRPIDRTLAN